MSDPVDPAVNPTDPAVNPAVGVFEAVHKDIDAKVAEGQGGLRDKVVRKLADEELGKRADLLLSGVRKFSELKADLDRIETDFVKVNKPDVFENELGPDGKFVRKSKFSDAKVKEIAEATKKTKKQKEEVNGKIKKLEGALSKAMNEADYSVLKKVLGGKVEESDSASEEKAAE